MTEQPNFAALADALVSRLTKKGRIPLPPSLPPVENDDYELCPDPRAVALGAFREKAHLQELATKNLNHNPYID